MALAVGLRAAYGLFHVRRDAFGFSDHYFHVGPELRLGRATERVFGYSQWGTSGGFRLDRGPSRDLGGHYGAGGGAWGRFGRLLAGGEGVFEFVHLSNNVRPLLSFVLSMSLGAWL